MRAGLSPLRVSGTCPIPKETAMAADSQIPHQAPQVREGQIIERIEDAAFLLTLFSAAAIIAAILLLFFVL
jgi:hypothetical protein